MTDLSPDTAAAVVEVPPHDPSDPSTFTESVAQAAAQAALEVAAHVAAQGRAVVAVTRVEVRAPHAPGDPLPGRVRWHPAASRRRAVVVTCTVRDLITKARVTA